MLNREEMKVRNLKDPEEETPESRGRVSIFFPNIYIYSKYKIKYPMIHHVYIHCPSQKFKMIIGLLMLTDFKIQTKLRVIEFMIFEFIIYLKSNVIFNVNNLHKKLILQIDIEKFTS